MGTFVSARIRIHSIGLFERLLASVLITSGPEKRARLMLSLDTLTLGRSFPVGVLVAVVVVVRKRGMEVSQRDVVFTGNDGRIIVAVDHPPFDIQNGDPSALYTRLTGSDR